MPARALCFRGPEDIAVVEEPIPEPDPGEALVETEYSAISPGTELLLYSGMAPGDLPADETISALDGDLDYPLRYGYAAVGRVAAVGDAVADSWLDRRVFAFHPHASHFRLPPAELHPVPEGCSPAEATLLPNVEAAVNFCMDAQPVVGERAVVFGQGVLGLLTTALLAQFRLRDCTRPITTRCAASDPGHTGPTRRLRPTKATRWPMLSARAARISPSNSRATPRRSTRQSGSRDTTAGSSSARGTAPRLRISISAGDSTGAGSRSKAVK